MGFQSPPFLSQLLQSGQYSDFSLICEGQHFGLHQAIVCPQSPVIAAALNGVFQEATTKELTVKEFDVATVRRMIKFIYTGDYEINPVDDANDSTRSATLFPTTDDGDNRSRIHLEGVKRDGIQSSSVDSNQDREAADTLLSHIRVNAIADYYNISRLAMLANSKIQSILKDSWLPRSFPCILKEVSGSTGDTALYSILASTAADHIEELVGSQDFAEMVGNDLSMSIIKACATRLRDIRTEFLRNQLLSRTETMRSDRIIHNIDDCLETLKETDSCRNCDATFDCYIEKHGKEHEPVYTLRCTECRCRHRSTS